MAFFLSALLLTALTLGLLLPLGAAETGRTHTVAIEAMAFVPAEVRVRPGDRVVFQNRDLLPHTATASDAKAFDSGAIEAGKSWTWEVAAGETAISYLCAYHPTMKGRIIVSPRTGPLAGARSHGG